MPRKSPLSVLGRKGLERLGLGPIAEEILEEPELPSIPEAMTFEELDLELETTDAGLRISPAFALEHELDIPEGEEWFVRVAPETEFGYEIAPRREVSRFVLPLHLEPPTPTPTPPEVPPITPPEPRNFIWDYDQGRFVQETPEMVKERLAFYAQHPEVQLFGEPRRLSQERYLAYQQGLLESVFPERSVEEVAELVESDPEAFFAHMFEIGQTKETVEFFMTFFPEATKEQIDLFFEPMSFVPEKPLTEVPIGAYLISKQPIESVSDFFRRDPDAFRIAILFEGRTEETEALVKEMFLTHERPPSVPGQLPVSRLVVLTPWVNFYGEELPDDILGVYFKDDLASKLMTGEYLPDPLKDYWKIHLQGWGDLARGYAGFADRIGADTLSRTLRLEALEGDLIARNVDYGEKGSIGWYVKQLTRMLPLIETAIATSLVPGGLAFNAAKAAGAGSFLAGTAGAIAAGVVATTEEAILEAGFGYNECISRGGSQTECNLVHDKIVLGNIGLLSITNTAQFGAAFFLPGGTTARLIIKGLLFGFASASEGVEEGGQLLINRYALGDEILVFDDEFWENFNLGMVGGLAFQGAGTVFTTIKSRIDNRMTDAQRGQWDTDVASARLQGMSLTEAESIAYDRYAETPEGQAVVTEVVEEVFAEEKEEAIQEVPKVMDAFASTEGAAPEVAETVREEPRLDNAVSLHPDNINWRNFLEKETTLKESAGGFDHYVSGNAHYVVAPDGRVLTYYGSRGISAFNELSSGELTMEDIDAETREVREAIALTAPPAGRLSPEAEAIVQEHLPKAEVAKELWQMTAVDYRVYKRSRLTPEQQKKWQEPERVSGVRANVESQWDAEHRALVEQAIAEGSPVPTEVLADYPDLEAKAPSPSVKPPSPPTVAEQQENLEAIGSPEITEAQADYSISLFEKYLNSPDAATASELTKALYTRERGIRARRFDTEVEKLIVEQGMSEKDAIEAAKTLTLTKKLPIISAENLPEFTAAMTESLYAKIYLTLKGEAFEIVSTTDALTNALAGKPIPRIVGVKGGSAFTRLQRVFGYDFAKSLDTQASQGRSLQDVMEGTLVDPVPIDADVLDYTRSLRDDPSAQPTYLGPVEAAPPPRPPTGIPPEWNDAFKEVPLIPEPHKPGIVKIAKFLGWQTIDLLNAMRINKSSLDASALRQLSLLALNHRMAVINAGIEGHKAAWSQEAYDALMTRIHRSPLFHYYEVTQQRFTGRDPLREWKATKGMKQSLAAEESGYLTEERVIPRTMARLPHIKLSARGFTAWINGTVWTIYEQAYAKGLKRQENIASGKTKLKEGEAFDMQTYMDEWAEALAIMSGRGSMGSFTTATPAIAAIVFAPRLWAARLQFPKLLLSSNPQIRAEAWKDLVTFVGGIGTMIWLGAMLGYWDVETDPRSANFGQIRIHNTRIDPWGGFKRHAVFLARLVDGTGLSGDTGMEYISDPISATANYLRGGLSPGASLIVDAVKGKTFIGEEFDVVNPKQWADRVAPFSVQDFYEAYQDSPATAYGTFIPGFFGAGITTYTGDWKDNVKNLGLPKYEDNLSYGLNEPVYDVRDFWADTAGDFTGVDPETLTKEKGFPPYIKALAEAVEIKKELEVIPNQSFISINADPADGATFVQYYKMWGDRSELSEGEQKDFDADERTRNAHLGNMTQREYALLVEYHSLANDELKEDFLEAHPELGVNRRDDWLKSHPEENAKLAIWGQARVLTKASYDRARQLIEEFDIPDNAVAEYLPPENIADVYFERNDIVEEWGSNSWEDKLHRGKNPELNKWLGLAPITASLPSLELKVQYRTQLELWDAYGSKKSPEYLSGVRAPGEDKSPRERAREKLLEDNPGFEEARHRISAYDKGLPDSLVENYVDYYLLPILGYDREVYLRDHPDFYEYWVEELGHSEIDFDGLDRRIATAAEKGVRERLRELPPAKPIPMHLLSTDEIINILQGEPARDWWEGMMWLFGGGMPDEEEVRKILAAYGATPEEIEKLLALIGSTFEGRSIENVDQLVALVQNLSREGLSIVDILGRLASPVSPAPLESPAEEKPGHPLLAALHKEFEETLVHGRK